MSDPRAASPLRWFLAAGALCAAVGAGAAAGAWEGLGGPRGFLAQHRAVAGFGTFGLICLGELAIRRAARAGRPVIGPTVFGLVMDAALVATYFAVLGPMALLSRSARPSPGDFRPTDTASYWTPREPSPIDRRTMSQQ